MAGLIKSLNITDAILSGFTVTNIDIFYIPLIPTVHIHIVMHTCIYIVYNVSCACSMTDIVYKPSVSPRINEKGGGGDLAGAQSMKLYLGVQTPFIHTPFIV